MPCSDIDKKILGSREAFPFSISDILDPKQERRALRRRQGTRRSLLASGLLAAQQAVRRGAMGVGAVLWCRCPLAYIPGYSPIRANCLLGANSCLVVGLRLPVFVCACWYGSFVESRLACCVPLFSSFSIGLARVPCNRAGGPPLRSAVVLRACSRRSECAVRCFRRI